MAKKSGKFRCAKCDRSFSMAAHLGRHMATLHGGRPGKSAAPLSAPRRGRPPKAASAVGGNVTNLLPQVQSWRKDLVVRQTQLQVQLDALDQLAAALDGRGTAAVSRGRPATVVRPALGGRGRRGRAGSLKTFIDRVLRDSGRPMRVSEVAAAVRSAGYATKNKSFAKSVGIALADMPSVAKLDRGVFKAK